MHSRRRRRLAALAAGACCCTAAFLVVPRPGALRDDPGALVTQVEDAVLQARSTGASRRAPMNLAQAEDAYAQALLERRRQDMRFAFRRDYREVERVLAVALHRAETAATLTRQGLGRDRAQASRLVADAESRARALGEAADAVWIAEPLRKRLQRSRALASQARALLDGGAYEDAAAQARAATHEAAQVSSAIFDVTSRFTDPDHLRVWRTWVADAVAWSKRTGKTALVVDKDAHVLLVYQGGRVVREYTAELGWNNVGDKRRQGDGATPEGRYKITELKGRGRSRYHKALLMDYPNAEDLKHLAQLKAAGVVPANTRAGGLIEIHGEGGRGKDWTDGCVAITNEEMDWLFSRVAVGTPVIVVGSRAGDGSFSRIARSTQP